MKNLFKKLGALLVAAVMVLSMCTAAFAANREATITINNAGKATFSYVQIIRPNPSKTTGWEFTSDAVIAHYVSELKAKDEQDAIAKLIQYKKNNTGITTKQVEDALKAVLSDANIGRTPVTGSSFTVTEAGVYAIKGEEENYSFSPMAAYVAFKDYDTTTGVPTDLEDATVEAKKQTQIIEKSTEEADKVTEIGREENYTINTMIPYIDLSRTEGRYYKFKDVLTGGSYVLNDNGKLVVKVTASVPGYESGKNVEVDVDATTIAGKQSFVLDLSEFVKDSKTGKAINTYANTQLTLQYTVKVTDIQVDNTIIASGSENASTPDYGGGSENLYTGEITLTKYASDDNNNDLEDNEKLANAEFKVYKKVKSIVNDEEVTTIKWARFDAAYKLLGWDNNEANATIVKTDADGFLTVEGLDVDAAGIEYFFKEVKAPEGYSINTTDVSATLQLTAEEGKETIAKGITHADTHMIDTTLAELPSTGGMGTYLFTIIGVVVMAGAAGAFFISRRRETEE